MKIGVDMVDVEDVRKFITAGKGSFLHRTFTYAEIAYCEGRPAGTYQCYAGKFAAKEAFMKAMGMGWSKELQWGSVEVLNNQAGAPYFALCERVRLMLEERGWHEVALSISHTKDQAIAFVLIS